MSQQSLAKNIECPLCPLLFRLPATVFSFFGHTEHSQCTTFSQETCCKLIYSSIASFLNFFEKQKKCDINASKPTVKRMHKFGGYSECGIIPFLRVTHGLLPGKLKL